LIKSSVPIDLRVLKIIKQSPLAIDIYCWLTFRMSYLRKKTSILWETLQLQFGSDYSFTPQGKRDFKKAFIRELKKVHVLYTDPKLTTNSEYLILEPSKPHIKPTKKLWITL